MYSIKYEKQLDPLFGVNGKYTKIIKDSFHERDAKVIYLKAALKQKPESFSYYIDFPYDPYNTSLTQKHREQHSELMEALKAINVFIFFFEINSIDDPDTLLTENFRKKHPELIETLTFIKSSVFSSEINSQDSLDFKETRKSMLEAIIAALPNPARKEQLPLVKPLTEEQRFIRNEVYSRPLNIFTRFENSTPVTIIEKKRGEQERAKEDEKKKREFLNAIDDLKDLKLSESWHTNIESMLAFCNDAGASLEKMLPLIRSSRIIPIQLLGLKKEVFKLILDKADEIVFLLKNAVSLNQMSKLELDVLKLLCENLAEVTSISEDLSLEKIMALESVRRKLVIENAQTLGGLLALGKSPESRFSFHDIMALDFNKLKLVLENAEKISVLLEKGVLFQDIKVLKFQQLKVIIDHIHNFDELKKLSLGSLSIIFNHPNTVEAKRLLSSLKVSSPSVSSTNVFYQPGSSIVACDKSSPPGPTGS